MSPFTAAMSLTLIFGSICPWIHALTWAPVWLSRADCPNQAKFPVGRTPNLHFDWLSDIRKALNVHIKTGRQSASNDETTAVQGGPAAALSHKPCIVFSKLSMPRCSKVEPRMWGGREGKRLQVFTQRKLLPWPCGGHRATRSVSQELSDSTWPCWGMN